MSRTTKDLFSTDWEKELQSKEVAKKHDGDKEIPVVLLAGLQRLARKAGIVKQRVTIHTPFDSITQAIFTSVFKTLDGDEVEFVGTADCSRKNTGGKFLDYPTAVAESRAEARSLRKALGIQMLSSEEIGLRENFGTLEAAPLNSKADTQLIVAIEKICETKNIPPINVLEEVIKNKERAATIFELSELTTEEAQGALEWLNAQEVVIKKLSTKEQRDARKKELQNEG